MESLHVWKLLGLWVGIGTELVWVRKMITIFVSRTLQNISVVSHKDHSPAAQETTPVSLFFFFFLIMQLICIYWKSLKTKDGY